MLRAIPLFFAVSLAAIFSPLAHAESQVIIRQAPSDAATTQDFSTQSLFTIPPSTSGSSSKMSYYLAVVNVYTGQVIPNSSISVDYSATANSGGHDHHDNSRPKGTYVPESGNTGSSGWLLFTYTAPQVSGEIYHYFTCVSGDDSPCWPAYGYGYVLVPDLAALGAGTNYTLIGQTGAHQSNHYGTFGTNQALVSLANAFAARFPGSVLQYNDISLQWGGLFDISSGWASPHKSHRFGNNVDFNQRAVRVSRREALRQLIRAQGFAILDEGNHWHFSR